MSTDAAQSVDRNILLRNLGLLARVDPALADRIGRTVPDGSVAVVPSRSGEPTASVQTPDGRRIWLHSRYHPADEAERFAGQLDADADNFCQVINGFGLGHHVKAVARRTGGQSLLIVVEPNLQILRAAFEHMDFAETLAPGRFVLLDSDDPGQLHEKLTPHSSVFMLGAQLLAHPSAERLDREFHARMRTALTDYAAFCRTSLVTLVGNARTTCTNIALNLPTLVATPPIDILADRFKGFPGVVVSAGPSLRKNVDQLAGVADRLVIVGVQTVLKPLLSMGVRPDFVTSLDYHEISRRFFEGIGDFGDIHLVAEPKANPRVIEAFGGPVSLLSNSFATLCLGPELGDRGGLRAGATVAHLAFYLAQYLGCDPIILIGQDLGFTGGVYYSPGVALHQAWRPELGRWVTMELKEWQRIVRSRQILRKAVDQQGRDIYTDEQMFTYVQQFERDFAQSPARVIDATEGGLAKKGAEAMPLAGAIQRFCTRPIPRERLAYRRETCWYDASRLAAGREAIARRREELAAFRRNCRQTAELLGKLQKLTDKPAEFNRRLRRVEELRRKVLGEQGTILRMVTDMSQLAELRKFSADRRLELDRLDGVEKVRRQLGRDAEFVKGLTDGCDELEELLKRTLRRFDEAGGD